MPRRKELGPRRRHQERAFETGRRPGGRPSRHKLEKAIVLTGTNAVAAALGSSRLRLERVLLKDGALAPRLMELSAAAVRRGIEVKRVPADVLSDLAGDSLHQGVVGVISRWPYLEESDLAGAMNAEAGPPFFLILDHLEDVGNFGAIIRSAHLCGCRGIIIPADRSAQITTASARSSAGALVYGDIYRVTNLNRAIGKLKDHGLWIFGLDAAGKSILKADLTVPLALVVGGEHAGLSRLVREACDGLLGLPMKGVIGSFNASVAAGIALFEVMRQRIVMVGNR